jgi:hypothetical protein
MAESPSLACRFHRHTLTPNTTLNGLLTVAPSLVDEPHRFLGADFRAALAATPQPRVPQDCETSRGAPDQAEFAATTLHAHTL